MWCRLKSKASGPWKTRSSRHRTPRSGGHRGGGQERRTPGCGGHCGGVCYFGQDGSAHIFFHAGLCRHRIPSRPFQGNGPARFLSGLGLRPPGLGADPAASSRHGRASQATPRAPGASRPRPRSRRLDPGKPPGKSASRLWRPPFRRGMSAVRPSRPGWGRSLPPLRQCPGTDPVPGQPKLISRSGDLRPSGRTPQGSPRGGIQARLPGVRWSRRGCSDRTSRR